MRYYVLFAACSLSGALIGQQPGELDQSFGDGGKVVLDWPILGTPYDDVHVAARFRVHDVSDGRLVLSFRSPWINGDRILLRLTSEGVLDTPGIDTVTLYNNPYHMDPVRKVSDSLWLVVNGSSGSIVNYDGQVVQSGLFQDHFDMIPIQGAQYTVDVRHRYPTGHFLITGPILPVSLTWPKSISRFCQDGSLDSLYCVQALNYGPTTVCALSGVNNFNLYELQNGGLLFYTYSGGANGHGRLTKRDWYGNAYCSKSLGLNYSIVTRLALNDNEAVCMIGRPPPAYNQGYNGSPYKLRIVNDTLDQMLPFWEGLVPAGYSLYNNLIYPREISALASGDFIVAGTQFGHPGWVLVKVDDSALVDSIFVSDDVSFLSDAVPAIYTEFDSVNIVSPKYIMSLENGMLLVAGHINTPEGLKICIARYHNGPDPRSKAMIIDSEVKC